MKHLFFFALSLMGATCGFGDTPPQLYPITEFGPNFPQPGSVKIGYIDKSGQVVVSPTADILTDGSMDPRSVEGFREGLQPVSVGLNTKWPALSWGFLDTAGHFAIEPQFEGAAAFSEGLAAVSDKKGGPPWARGYIDHTGKYVIPPQFEDAGPFTDGVAIVTKRGGWLRGIIDRDGKWIVPPTYPSMSVYSEGLVCVGKYVPELTAPPPANNMPPMTWGFIDKTGKQVIDFKFKEPAKFSGGLAAINEGGACGYIDKTGAYAIQPQFRMGWDFSEGLARVNLQSGGAAYIDPKGTVLFTVPGLMWAEPFSEGLAAVQVKQAGGQPLYGFIDRHGAFVIPPHYILATSFSGGLARVTATGKYDYIDTTGKVVWEGKVPDFGAFGH